ncbi:hypothetical protein BURCENBC7_AP6288 [Burkholderia cenocepacia BC7]|nr:hypothetical protein BURCENK562V_C1935 [Burkholderia cenocepacia K56-2Valvano]ERI29974.1 hypothetical protein BURCENBC7_AP6288 [Burkholderia cenocepacia BC7]
MARSAGDACRVRPNSRAVCLKRSNRADPTSNPKWLDNADGDSCGRAAGRNGVERLRGQPADGIVRSIRPAVPARDTVDETAPRLPGRSECAPRRSNPHSMPARRASQPGGER